MDDQGVSHFISPSKRFRKAKKGEGTSKRLYTLKEAAIYLGRGLQDAGSPGCVKIGRKVGYLVDLLIKWLEERANMEGK